MICLNSGGNLVRSQVEARESVCFFRRRQGAERPARSYPLRAASFSHRRRRYSERGPRAEQGELAIDRATVPRSRPENVAVTVRGRKAESVLRGTRSSHTSPPRDDGSERPRPTPRRGRRNRDSKCYPTLRRAWPRDLPGAAICVQDVDVQCVLQFTLIHAAGCALHRHTSRVIHRLEL